MFIEMDELMSALNPYIQQAKIEELVIGTKKRLYPY